MGEAETAASAAVDEAARRSIINRLKRLEGQVRGLQSMIESGKSCDDVLTQLMAAKSALNQIGLRIISHSMKTCFTAEGDRTKDEIVEDALEVFLKYVNCVK